MVQYRINLISTKVFLGLLVDTNHTGHIGASTYQPSSEQFVDQYTFTVEGAVKHVQPFLHHIFCPVHICFHFWPDYQCNCTLNQYFRISWFLKSFFILDRSDQCELSWVEWPQWPVSVEPTSHFTIRARSLVQLQLGIKTLSHNEEWACNTKLKETTNSVFPLTNLLIFFAE